jgi:hypothetical protein
MWGYRKVLRPAASRATRKLAAFIGRYAAISVAIGCDEIRKETSLIA